MPEMVEVVKNQDKRSGQCIVWFCWSVIGVTSLTHLGLLMGHGRNTTSLGSNGISNI